MSKDQKTCPICGCRSTRFLIDGANLDFLNDLANENQINTAVSLTKIIWESIPQLRLTADARAIVDALSKTLVVSTQEQVSKILEPMKIFMETFPMIIEKLPEELRKDVREEFSETRLKLEDEFKVLRETAPSSKDILSTIQTIADTIDATTERKMDEVRQELACRFKETLERAGFPEPEQMKLLAQLIPSTLLLLEELLRFQKVPKEKGEQGELELIQQLADFYPEDHCEHLGKPGDTDILAMPRFNGTTIGQILVESKKNNSGWHELYIQQVRRHMKLRNERFAILAVEVMPKGVTCFMSRHFIEGAIIVTSIQNFYIAYGALRSVLIALAPFSNRNFDVRKLFTDKKIEEALQDAYQYQEKLRKIRTSAHRIEKNAKNITENANEIDDCLKRSLKELQNRINGAVQEIVAHNKPDNGSDHK